MARGTNSKVQWTIMRVAKIIFGSRFSNGSISGPRARIACPPSDSLWLRRLFSLEAFMVSFYLVLITSISCSKRGLVTCPHWRCRFYCSFVHLSLLTLKVLSRGYRGLTLDLQDFYSALTQGTWSTFPWNWFGAYLRDGTNYQTQMCSCH